MALVAALVAPLWHGWMRNAPPPRGWLRAELEAPPPGIEVHVAPGRPPALFLRNTGSQEVVVLDDAGGVAQRIAPGAAHSFLEPRAGYEGALPRHGGETVLNHWRVPLRVGGAVLEIRGVNRWVPAP